MNKAVCLYILAIAAGASCTIIPPRVIEGIVDRGSSIIRQNLPIPTTTQPPYESDESSETSPAEDIILNAVENLTQKLKDVKRWIDETLPTSTNSEEQTNSPSTTAASESSSTTRPYPIPSTRQPYETPSTVRPVYTLPTIKIPLPTISTRNLASLLPKVDLSNITVPVPVIPVPQYPPKLPDLPGLRENVEYARNRVTQALGGGSDLRTAIQKATERAIHSVDPVSAVASLSNTILKIFYNVAQNCPVRRVGAAVLQDGLIIVGNVIKSVVSIAQRDAAKVANVLG